MAERSPIRICVAGACGRMGQRILSLAHEQDLVVGGAFDVPANAGQRISFPTREDGTSDVTVAENAQAALQDTDVLLDFTVAEAVIVNAHAAAEAGVPMVIGTSGLADEQNQTLHRFAGTVPVIVAANTSVGVNLLFTIAAEVAAVLGLDYNVEITETHHNKKLDSPSGTAVRLIEVVSDVLGLDPKSDVVHGRHGFVGERSAAQIGVHALRGGDVAGEHTISFIGQGERLELTHRAHSRDTFARGALRAARFAAGAEPGYYDMQDVLGLTK